MVIRQPIEIRPGQPLPALASINWNSVSEVQVWGRLSGDAKKIIDAALTNKTRRVTINSQDDEARLAVDNFVTGANN